MTHFKEKKVVGDAAYIESCLKFLTAGGVFEGFENFSCNYGI